MGRLRALLDGAGGAGLARPAVRLQARLRARLTDVAGAYGLRVEPGRRAALAMAVVAVLAAAVAGWWVLQARPHSTPLAVDPTSTASVSPSRTSQSRVSTPTGSAPAAGSPSTGSPPTGSPPAASSAQPGGSAAAPVGTSSAADLVVDVAGKVARPGIYHLALGTRVADAVQAAGGALPGTELTTLNLARKLSDGEQIAVGVVGAADAGPAGVEPAGGGGATGGSAARPVNLNSATLAQLVALPGLGPALAQRVLGWRGEHGRFDSVDQLREVSGIGEAKFAALRPLVTVSG